MQASQRIAVTGATGRLGRHVVDVLEDVELDRDSDHYWRWDGTTHVDPHADFGEHTIRIKCGDNWLEEDFFVQDGDGPGGDVHTSVYPKGSGETGGGPEDPVGLVALGLTGVLGAGLAGAGAVLERRGARR